MRNLHFHFKKLAYCGHGFVHTLQPVQPVAKSGVGRVAVAVTDTERREIRQWGPIVKVL